MQRFSNHADVLTVYLDKQDPDEAGCSRRRPDVRLLTLFGTAIVECDEHQHRSSNYACLAADIKAKWSELHLSRVTLSERLRLAEDSRLSEIVNSGTIEPTTVWRWNPDRYRDAAGQVVELSEADRLEALGDDIQAWLDQLWTPKHFIQVVYMFYNGQQRQEDFVPIDGDEYRQWRQTLGDQMPDAQPQPQTPDAQPQQALDDPPAPKAARKSTAKNFKAKRQKL